jgi:GNAT superfamily N-acetyltransferase
MIRTVTAADMTGLSALLVASGLFGPNDLAEVSGMVTAYVDGSLGNDHYWVVDDGDDTQAGPLAVAYYAPERMTEGTWNFYLIAVHPDYQGQGRGATLLRFVEQALAARGERILLVETSGLPSFERTRAFYRKCGYDEEARIREFYSAGQDKVIFRKALTQQV